MKIRRFSAADMRQAIRRVRDELGPDAVILSSHNVDEDYMARHFAKESLHECG